jgi:hypothetical protein
LRFPQYGLRQKIQLAGMSVDRRYHAIDMAVAVAVRSTPSIQPISEKAR